jgi:hypothetical protein
MKLTDLERILSPKGVLPKMKEYKKEILVLLKHFSHPQASLGWWSFSGKTSK